MSQHLIRRNKHQAEEIAKLQVQTARLVQAVARLGGDPVAVLAGHLPEAEIPAPLASDDGPEPHVNGDGFEKVATEEDAAEAQGEYIEPEESDEGDDDEE